MKRRKYKQFGEDAWRRHIERQADSGRSVTAYCKKNKLSVSSFRRWRGVIYSAREETGFIRLDQRDDNRPACMELAITTPNGYRVEISNVEAGIAVARSLAEC